MISHFARTRSRGLGQDSQHASCTSPTDGWGTKKWQLPNTGAGQTPNAAAWHSGFQLCWLSIGFEQPIHLSLLMLSAPKFAAAERGTMVGQHRICHTDDCHAAGLLCRMCFLKAKISSIRQCNWDQFIYRVKTVSLLLICCGQLPCCLPNELLISCGKLDQPSTWGSSRSEFGRTQKNCIRWTCHNFTLTVQFELFKFNFRPLQACCLGPCNVLISQKSLQQYGGHQGRSSIQAGLLQWGDDVHLSLAHRNGPFAPCISISAR